MNQQHFRQLQKDRQDSLRLLEKTSMRGIRDSIVEKYSEPAHFVYELLQNADDVQATYVKFILREEGLYFIHNGQILFNVTPPNQVKTGHINAITSIGNSSKSTQTNTIGKFGVGFKSVFQYTQNPHIYDPNIAFKIRDFIVPELLDELLHPLKEKDETLFFFPFDHPVKTAKQAFQEIEQKLKKLRNPSLFLNHLQRINWQMNAQFGYFEIEQISDKEIDNTQVEWLKSIQKIGKKSVQQLFLKFSRKEPNNNLSYSIVYHLDEDGDITAEAPDDVYCYFPTKVNTPFSFLLHAPFLLTDSREGIKTGDVWNQTLLQLLAQLQADSLDILKTEALLTANSFLAFPYEVEKGNRQRNSTFSIFYETFLQKLQKGVLLPTNDEHFVGIKDAYLAESSPLLDLFSNSQLANLVKNPTARWVFPKLAPRTPLWELVKTKLTAPIEKWDNQGNVNAYSSGILTTEYLVRRINIDFIAAQTDTWLQQFYKDMFERYRSLWQGEQAILRYLPILRRFDNKMTAAYDVDTQQPLVWLPTSIGTDYPTIKKDFIQNELSLSFFQALGLTKPATQDEIQQHILPKYQQSTPNRVLDFEHDFEKIWQHYQSSTINEAEKLVVQLRDIPFLQAICLADGRLEYKKATELYFGSKHLQTYFEGQAVFMLLPDFILGNDLDVHPQKMDFIRKLGVRFYPYFQLLEDHLDEEQKMALRQIETPEATLVMWESSTDYELEGLTFLLEKEFDTEQSQSLWTTLFSIPSDYYQDKTQGTYTYQWKTEHQQTFQAGWLEKLRNTSFLLDKNGQWRTPNAIEISDLDPIYSIDLEHYLTKKLFEKEVIEDRLAGLNTEERLAIEIGQRFLKEGFSESDLLSLKAWKARKAERENRKKRPQPTPKTPSEPEKDVDEFNPAFLSSEELLQKQAELRRQMESELEEKMEDLLQIEQLKNTIQNTEKYSYAWFLALLELEYILAFEQNEKDRSISIHFEKVEQEEGADKTLFLKRPSRNLPINIEEMGDISLRLQLADERRILEVEVVSIKNNSLRAKLKSIDALEGVDFKKICGATLVIQDTIFTLEELVKSFKELPFQPTDHLQQKLPDSIRFIFGPPGTGKTTYLAQQEIMPILLGDEPTKILVLTPTNKAADVLALKLLSILPDIPSSLMRFGVTTDDAVETAGLLKDSTFDFRSVEHCCVITTITRFPYDGFNNGSWDYKLKNIDWDIILFDEASMLTLASIVYTIYQKPSAEFVIAGDPFQIEPIVFAEEWKGENIYSLVNLESFDPDLQKEQLIPHSFEVVNLNTQYRAVSTLGYLYSHFAYEGKLRHHRFPKDQRPLNLKKMPLKDVNIIRFPVHKMETLFRPQRLFRSHYHIYSALLTVEMIKYLIEEIAAQVQPKEKPWRIGIICPYKAQATLVDKVLSAQNISNPKVRWVCGTIHSFQGDECEIIVTLLNPPLHISKSPNMFLNKKNILNVAISRASDYLILLIPDTQTENIENLYQVNRIQGIINYYLKGVCQDYRSMDIEEILFDKLDFIEQNAFATTHQSVNVYVEPEKKYEIRCEETAVDVQVNSLD